MNRFGLVVCLVLGTLLLANCAPYDLTRRVVHQGNLLPQSKIAQLKPGMTKEDVAILMGTSLVSPLFNLDRWDYVHTLRIAGGRPQVRSYSLYFSKGILRRIVVQGAS